MAPKLDRLQGPEIDPSRLQDNIQRALDQIPAAAPLAPIAGAVRASLAFVASPQVFQHGLGHAAGGFLVGRATKPSGLAAYPQVAFSNPQPTSIDQTRSAQLETTLATPVTIDGWWY